MRRFALAAALAITSVAAPAFAAGSETAQERHNKALVMAFYDKALNAKDFDAAAKYLGDRYTQHNPTAKDGPEGLRGFIAFLKEKFPNSHSEIKQAFADGDYVILHVHSVREPGTRGNAIIDIFKLERGKVVEHWDAVQPIPENPMNSNTMF
ncbi:nuclear transport factor 2 family protein [Sphingomonas sp. MMS24-J13]|uniref:nuclear transport factor 2 family protein n=1 Tax=Sphingomonas sp. MMS24-J13 TaxID=3238686 RepID=UPI0038512629